MRRPLVVVLLVLLLNALIAQAVMAPEVSAQGRTFRGAMGHTASFDLDVPKGNALLWSFPTGDQVESSPVPYGGKVYFGANNGYLFAVDSVRGTEAWKLLLGGQVMASPTISDDGIIYIGCTNHTFYAIDAATGEEQWHWTVPDPYAQIISSAAIDGQRAYFGASDKHIHAINLTTHKEDWNYTVKGDVWGSPALYAGRVYIGILGGEFVSLFKDNGTLAWNFTTKTYEGIYSSPAIADGKVVFSTARGDECVYALNATTGALIWCFKAPGPGYGSPAIHNGTIYIPTWNPTKPGGMLWALPLDDPTPGDGVMENSSIKWSAYIGDIQGGSSPIYSKGRVLVGSDDGMGGNGKMLCFDAANGNLLWNLTMGGDVYSTPAVSDGIAFVGSMDGRMYAVGGDPNATMVVQVLPESTTLQGGHVVGISFLVTYRGLPLEGAFVKVNVSAGELSQNGASTFPDGSQRIKYQAPKVQSQTQVTFTADATFFGIETAHGSANLTILPASVYKVSSTSALALSKYVLYFGLLTPLIVVNVIFVLHGRKVSKETPKEVPKDGK
jgi:outer membrane protein assembly factor BamB